MQRVALGRKKCRAGTRQEIALYSIRLYFPFADRMTFGVELDADFNNRQTGACESGGIILEVDLPHGSVGGTVDFQLEEINCLVCSHHHIYTADRGAHFHIDVVKLSYQRENDEEHLLVMPLVIRVIALWDGEQEGLKQRLAKPSGAVQENVVAQLNHFVDILRLINI